MYPARTALYEETATLRASRKPVMAIADPLHKPFEGYRPGPLTSLQPEQDRFLLLPDAGSTSETLTPASQWTADDRVKTLDFTTKIQHTCPLRIPPMSDRQVREALAFLTRNDGGTSGWLCWDGHFMYLCSYSTFKQQLLVAYRDI